MEVVENCINITIGFRDGEKLLWIKKNKKKENIFKCSYFVGYIYKVL